MEDNNYNTTANLQPGNTMAFRSGGPYDYNDNEANNDNDDTCSSNDPNHRCYYNSAADEAAGRCSNDPSSYLYKQHPDDTAPFDVAAFLRYLDHRGNDTEHYNYFGSTYDDK